MPPLVKCDTGDNNQINVLDWDQITTLRFLHTKGTRDQFCGALNLDKLEILSTDPGKDQRFITIKSLLDDLIGADLVMNGAVESQMSGITKETGTHKAPLNFCARIGTDLT
jgi:hypothetical protein